MIIGHQKQRQFLKKMSESGKLPHALLFTGQEKLGKKTIALDFISSLFDEETNNHPDFIFVEPQEKTLQIEQIRELSRRLSLKPIKAPLLAAVIDRADRMTKDAQNCFLKTLEEPRGKTLLILVSNQPNSLLPTIISRCQLIKFYPVRETEIREFLLARQNFSEKNLGGQGKGISNEESEYIVKISLGRPGTVIDFLSSPEKLEARKKTAGQLTKLLSAPLSVRFQYVEKKLAEEENLNEVLDVWLSFFRENLLSGLNVHPAGNASLLRTKNILEYIQKINSLFSTTNINPRLALETLMLEL